LRPLLETRSKVQYQTMNASPPRGSQLKTIVVLFVVLRLTILFLYTPQGLLNAYTDYSYYYRTAQLSDQGFYPFVNMWSEHLPPLAYTSELVYRATQALVPTGNLDSFGYQLFARLLGSVMLLFETGVLILIHRLAERVWDMATADRLSWIYSALSLPIFFWNASQMSNVTFFALLAVYWFITHHQTRSAVALGLSIWLKLTPIFLLAPIAKFIWGQWRGIVRYVLIIAVIGLVIFAPFIAAGGGEWIAASLRSTFARASWSTPWAIIDGNWGVGDVGDLSAHLQLDQAAVVQGNPPVIPSIVILIAFAIIYLWFFFRPIVQHGPRQFIWFTTLTAMIFHLWSKGWSPQWSTLIIPLILLSFPDRRGLQLTLGLTLIIFIEWPLADAFQSHLLLATAIMARTALFIIIAILSARELWTSPASISSARDGQAA
jgi:hypothetical protein